jgi:hypothetical protein
MSNNIKTITVTAITTLVVNALLVHHSEEVAHFALFLLYLSLGAGLATAYFLAFRKDQLVAFIDSTISSARQVTAHVKQKLAAADSATASNYSPDSQSEEAA